MFCCYCLFFPRILITTFLIQLYFYHHIQLYFNYHIPPSGPVKKTTASIMKIVHEKCRPVTGKGRTAPEVEAFKESLQMAAEMNKELQPHLSRAQEILNPRKVLQLFRRIPDSVRCCLEHCRITLQLSETSLLFFLFIYYFQKWIVWMVCTVWWCSWQWGKLIFSWNVGSQYYVLVT